MTEPKSVNDVKLIIYGCGGHARSVANVALKKYLQNQILLLDENAVDGEKILGCSVKREYTLLENQGYIVAIGDNLKRKKLYETLLRGQAGKPESVISEQADIGWKAKIERGTFVASGTHIGPEAWIGEDTIINTGSVIEHEAMIGDHTHIAPHVTICGRSRIGDNVFCGAGSIVIDKITVCNNVIIGAGAVVKEDILEAGTYVGVPAKKIRA